MSSPEPHPPRDSSQGAKPNYLKHLDYSVLQQCMHCGMCLPTCPTYVETGREKNSPRGRIALMRAVADDELDVTKAFADEMYYCLGCLACVSACPAGVDYAHLFENARAQVEVEGVAENPKRNFYRWLAVKTLFMRPRLLRLVGRSLWLYQKSGLQTLLRKIGFMKLLPKELRELEPQTPKVCAQFSHQRIAEREEPAGETRYRVGLLTGCVQDLTFSDINRDTVNVLLENGCAVFTPPVQPCCGSLHGHNGELELSRTLARRLLDLFDLDALDAVITNAAGCGSHLKHYGRLLADDPAYAAKAAQWDTKLFDIHEWLVKIGFRKPQGAVAARATYHEACHLCHGQGITKEPREVLRAIPGLELTELAESTWCCGSAGIYNITQPEQSQKLLARKVGHLQQTGSGVVATANPGCHLQVQNGLRAAGSAATVRHPVSLLAEAYRAERSTPRAG